MQKTIPACLLILCVSGCIIIPLKPEVTSGHKYSKREIAFLDFPDATREEVLSTLGEPFYELRSPGVLLYIWETTPRFQITPPTGIGKIDWGDQTTTVKGEPHYWGLFIGYDDSSYVIAHEIRKVGTSGFGPACVKWRLSHHLKLR